MTPDAAGRPERSDLTVDQHRMVAPSRVWLMPPPGDPTWYAGTWKSNPLTVVVGDVPYIPESEVTRLRAEVEALVMFAFREGYDEGIFDGVARGCTGHRVGQRLAQSEAIDRLAALLAARKGEEV